MVTKPAGQRPSLRRRAPSGAHCTSGVSWKLIAFATLPLAPIWLEDLGSGEPVSRAARIHARVQQLTGLAQPFVA